MALKKFSVKFLHLAFLMQKNVLFSSARNRTYGGSIPQNVEKFLYDKTYIVFNEKPIQDSNP